jgi:hypothetical protein
MTTVQLIMKVLGDPPPEGDPLPATLVRIDGIDEPMDLDHGPCLRFVFAYSDEPYQDHKAAALVSTALNQHSRLYALLRGLLGRDLEDGEDVTQAVRGLVGKDFLIVVEHRHRDSGPTFLDVVEAVSA